MVVTLLYSIYISEYPQMASERADLDLNLCFLIVYHA